MARRVEMSCDLLDRFVWRLVREDETVADTATILRTVYLLSSIGGKITHTLSGFGEIYRIRTWRELHNFVWTLHHIGSGVDIHVRETVPSKDWMDGAVLRTGEVFSEVEV